MIKAILDEFNETNSTNDKLEVMKKHKDNKLLIRVFQMALDVVKYTYGVTMKNVNAGSSENTQTLEWGLDNLLPLASREITGNAAISQVENILESMNENDREIIKLIINRDLKINFGKTGFNKVVAKENKCKSPSYQRCDIGTKKNIQKNIDFNKKVYSDIKMDGEFRTAIVNNEDVTFMSRAGNESLLPVIKEELISLNINGVLMGEINIRLSDSLFNFLSDKHSGNEDYINNLKKILNTKDRILPRSISNGLINSLNSK